MKQKPDIVLEATFINCEKIYWIFDAKYRIDSDNEAADVPPSDAINQMHRYRDALIHIHKTDDEVHEKSRPILGAFVLYPGFFDEVNSSNPYTAAIEAVGIGSFPLLPGNQNLWLKEFLMSRFPRASAVNYVIPEADQYLAEDSARIATLGTYLGRYKDLTLAASLGPGRDKAYVERFRLGMAGWYHMPVTTTDKKAIERNVMREIRYCAIGVHHSLSTGRVISHVYEVKSVRVVKRSTLTLEQSGKKIEPTNNEDYWLFELDDARSLFHPVDMPARTFKFQLTNAADVFSAKHWDELPIRYKVLA